MRQWLAIVGFSAVGIALGLGFGWFVDPVQFVNTTPASLRADFRADYVLMVAESYHSLRDVQFAQQQLSIFGGASPVAVCAEALQTAQQAAYSPDDLALIKELARELETASPIALPSISPP